MKNTELLSQSPCPELAGSISYEQDCRVEVVSFSYSSLQWVSSFHSYSSLLMEFWSCFFRYVQKKKTILSVEDIIALIGDKCDGVIGQVIYFWPNKSFLNCSEIIIFLFLWFWVCWGVLGYAFQLTENWGEALFSTLRRSAGGTAFSNMAVVIIIALMSMRLTSTVLLLETLQSCKFFSCLLYVLCLCHDMLAFCKNALHVYFVHVFIAMEIRDITWCIMHVWSYLLAVRSDVN